MPGFLQLLPSACNTWFSINLQKTVIIIVFVPYSNPLPHNLSHVSSLVVDVFLRVFISFFAFEISVVRRRLRQWISVQLHAGGLNGGYAIN